MKNLAILVVVAVAGYLAWTYMPGLRDSVTQAANKYGGWTEEARKNDPVGFIKHARGKLEKQIEEFEAKKGEFAKLRADTEKDLETHRNNEQNSTKLMDEFRELYRTAQENDAWPVTMLGKEYSMTQLKQQVNDLMSSREDDRKLQTAYQEVLDTIESGEAALRDQIVDTRSALADLKAQESMMKVKELTAESTELLAKVNELVETNTKLADDPIRSTDELMAAARKAAEAEAEKVGDTKVDDFLNG